MIFAKLYLDNKNKNKKKTVNTSSSSNSGDGGVYFEGHTHNNKQVLDTITEEDYTNLLIMLKQFQQAFILKDNVLYCKLPFVGGADITAYGAIPQVQDAFEMNGEMLYPDRVQQQQQPSINEGFKFHITDIDGTRVVDGDETIVINGYNSTYTATYNGVDVTNDISIEIIDGTVVENVGNQLNLLDGDDGEPYEIDVTYNEITLTFNIVFQK